MIRHDDWFSIHSNVLKFSFLKQCLSIIFFQTPRFFLSIRDFLLLLRRYTYTFYFNFFSADGKKRLEYSLTDSIEFRWENLGLSSSLSSSSSSSSSIASWETSRSIITSLCIRWNQKLSIFQKLFLSNGFFSFLSFCGEYFLFFYSSSCTSDFCFTLLCKSNKISRMVRNHWILFFSCGSTFLWKSYRTLRTKKKHRFSTKISKFSRDLKPIRKDHDWSDPFTKRRW